MKGKGPGPALALAGILLTFGLTAGACSSSIEETRENVVRQTADEIVIIERDLPSGRHVECILWDGVKAGDLECFEVSR